MVALLCIMLFLQLIFSPGTYTTQTIHTIEQQHQPQIDAVRNNGTLYNQVKIDYTDEASVINIKDMEEN